MHAQELVGKIDESLARLGVTLGALAELQKKHSAELEELQIKQAKEWDALVLPPRPYRCVDQFGDCEEDRCNCVL